MECGRVIIDGKSYSIGDFDASLKLKDFQNNNSLSFTLSNIDVYNLCSTVADGDEVLLQYGALFFKGRVSVGSTLNTKQYTKTSIDISFGNINWLNSQKDTIPDLGWYEVDKDWLTNIDTNEYNGTNPVFFGLKYYGGIIHEDGQTLSDISGYLPYSYLMPEVAEKYIIDKISEKYPIASNFFDSEYFRRTFRVLNVCDDVVWQRIVSSNINIVGQNVQVTAIPERFGSVDGFLHSYTSASYIQKDIRVYKEITGLVRFRGDYLKLKNNEFTLNFYRNIYDANNINVFNRELIGTYTLEKTSQQSGAERGAILAEFENISFTKNDYISIEVIGTGALDINAEYDVIEPNPTNNQIFGQEVRLNVLSDLKINNYLDDLCARYNLVRFYDQNTGLMIIDPKNDVSLPTGETIKSIYQNKKSLGSFCEITTESYYENNNMSELALIHNNDTGDYLLDEETNNYYYQKNLNGLTTEIQTELTSSSEVSLFPYRLLDISELTIPELKKARQVNYMSAENSQTTEYYIKTDKLLNEERYCYENRIVYKFGLSGVKTNFKYTNELGQEQNYTSLVYPYAVTYQKKGSQNSTSNDISINLNFENEQGIKGLAETFYKTDIDDFKNAKKLRVGGKIKACELINIRSLLLSKYYVNFGTLSGFKKIEELTLQFRSGIIYFSAVLF